MLLWNLSQYQARDALWPGRTGCKAPDEGHMSIWSRRATQQPTVLAATRVGRGAEQWLRHCAPILAGVRPAVGKRPLRGISLSGALAISTYCFGLSSSTCIPHLLRRT